MTRPAQTATLAVAALLTFAAPRAALGRDSIGGGDPRAAGPLVAMAQRCALASVAPDRSSSSDCLGCHNQREHASHPVEVDYARAAQGGGMMARDLRRVAEIERRGIRLVGGKVTCVTCHDAHSRAAYRIALPAQAVVKAAIDVRVQGSYARPVAPQRLSDLPEGSAVSPTELCKACHGLD